MKKLGQYQQIGTGQKSQSVMSSRQALSISDTKYLIVPKPAYTLVSPYESEFPPSKERVRTPIPPRVGSTPQ